MHLYLSRQWSNIDADDVEFRGLQLPVCLFHGSLRLHPGEKERRIAVNENMGCIPVRGMNHGIQLGEL